MNNVAWLRRWVAPMVDPSKSDPSQRAWSFWISLSFLFAIAYAGLALREAFAGDYVVQDDARQHVFWMQRFADPTLFPNDRIADYFQSVAPIGYTLLYRAAAAVGLDPFVFNKCLPLALGLITTGYCFAVCVQLLPIPIAGFTASLLLNQVLWVNDDLASATPRAFVYPLLLAFLFYWIRCWHDPRWINALPCGIAIVLQGLFYPQSVLLSAGVLVVQLVGWQSGRLGLVRRWRSYVLCCAGLGVSLLVLLPYSLQTSDFDPVITLAEARSLPEFQPGGRSSFFNSNAWSFWIEGDRSGILPRMERLPSLLYAGLLLPILLAFPSPFKRLALVRFAALRRLLDLGIVSIGWFFIAHAVLFKLHLPSRYTQHSLRIILCLASAIAIALIIDALWRWMAVSNRIALLVGLVCVALIQLLLVLFPLFADPFPNANYRVGEQPDLYEFLAAQPKDSLIASLSPQADLIPSFAGRSVLVSEEYAIPYHMGYYREFQTRSLALAQAQYSADWNEVKQLIQQYGIDFWLLDRGAFQAEYLRQNWINQYPDMARLLRRNLKQSPALKAAADECDRFSNSAVQVLDATCLLSQ